MSTNYPSKKLKHYNVPGHSHFITFSCYHNNDYLLDQIACEILENELNIVKIEENFSIWSYVFMPNHVHLLIFPLNERYSISSILKKLKGRMSRKYSNYLIKSSPEEHRKRLCEYSGGQYFKFWQHSSGFDKNVTDKKEIYTIINYIEQNPVRWKLVEYPFQWRWSSAFAKKFRLGLIPEIPNIK